MKKPAYVSALIGEPQLEKAKPWEDKQDFLTKEEADSLYDMMMKEPWISHKGDHPTDAFAIYYGLSYQGGGGARVDEIKQIPDFLKELSGRVSDRTKHPCNYVQVHRYGPAVPVRPHHDPAGMCVPMIVVGQERVFRVGGKMLPQYYKMDQARREVSGHAPEENILLRHGSLLIFNGGRTIHSMCPTSDDKQFNPNGFDWRISILFRYTTEAMREHGPGKKAKEEGDREQYEAAVKEWQESRSQ
jgi:hypothetical protein